MYCIESQKINSAKIPVATRLYRVALFISTNFIIQKEFIL